MDEGGNQASAVQQCEQFDGTVDFAKRRPLEQAQTQIGGGCVRVVGRIHEIESQVIVQVKLASAPDRNCGKVGTDSTVARLVCFGQCGAANVVAKFHGVKLAQALWPRQWYKSHDPKLL